MTVRLMGADARMLAQRVRAMTAESRAFAERVRAKLEARAAEESSHSAPRLVAGLQQRGLEQELALAAEELRAQCDELEAARDALESERAKYLDLFENAPEPYVVSDPEGRICEANALVAELLAFPLERLLHRPLINFVARQDTRAFRDFVAARRATAEAGSLTMRVRPRGKPVVRVEATARPLFAGDGRLLLLRWILRAAPSQQTSVAGQLEALVVVACGHAAAAGVGRAITISADVASAPGLDVDDRARVLRAIEGALEHAMAEAEHGATLRVRLAPWPDHATLTVEIDAPRGACVAAELRFATR